METCQSTRKCKPTTVALECRAYVWDNQKVKN